MFAWQCFFLCSPSHGSAIASPQIDAFDLARALAGHDGAAVSHVDLSGQAIGVAGAAEMAETLKSHASITSLDLDQNPITNAGTAVLAEALLSNHRLTSLLCHAEDMAAEAIVAPRMRRLALACAGASGTARRGARVEKLIAQLGQSRVRHLQIRVEDARLARLQVVHKPACGGHAWRGRATRAARARGAGQPTMRRA